MNLKKSFVGAVAGLALIGSIAAPIASAQVTETGSLPNTTSATVNVTSTGGFDVYFRGANLDFGTIDFNASSNLAVKKPGSLQIGYVDEMVNRPEFSVTLQAGNFNGANNWFSGDALAITNTYNVQQGQWGGVTAEHGDIGDIGTYQNGVDPNGQPATGVALPWTSNNTLGTARPVHYGWAGVGTIWSYGDVDVELTIPPTTAPDNYSSTLTLTVTAKQP